MTVKFFGEKKFFAKKMNFSPVLCIQSSKKLTACFFFWKIKPGQSSEWKKKHFLCSIEGPKAKKKAFFFLKKRFFSTIFSKKLQLKQLLFWQKKKPFFCFWSFNRTQKMFFFPLWWLCRLHFSEKKPGSQFFLNQKLTTPQRINTSQNFKKRTYGRLET